MKLGQKTCSITTLYIPDLIEPNGEILTQLFVFLKVQVRKLQVPFMYFFGQDDMKLEKANHAVR